MTLRVLADSVVANSDVLAYIPSPSQGVWQIGPFPLRAYALCIIVGIVVAIWWGERRWQERGGRSGTVLDVAMFAVPFGLVGGRLYHVATDWQKYFGEGGDPLDALKIYQGGLGIWGAVFLGGIGAWIGCRIYRIPLPAFGDAIAPPILLAQAIGRLGNYFNQELYGRETDLPWGLEINLRFDDDGKLDMMNGVSTGVVEKVVQPTFLYEMVWNLIVVVLLVQIDKRFRIGHGRLFALYVAGYCVGRFVVELLRDDEATHIAGIRINSFTAALVFLAAIAYFVFATKGRETAQMLQPDAVRRPWPWQFAELRAVGANPEVIELDAEAEAEAESDDDAKSETADEAEAKAESDTDVKSTEDESEATPVALGKSAAEAESATAATTESGESGESAGGATAEPDSGVTPSETNPATSKTPSATESGKSAANGVNGTKNSAATGSDASAAAEGDTADRS
ncbi:prolipoprotein diacylglyceryl transferase [Nocardia noduli]|uniref:prolipoprotein diacylglyceryl transferase n=1 Tax=Nocardia noduli TaxID=2815722 RepID=UPI001C20F8C9|nr:prolipoprotein diacylglyceryl transferase [Nocardia noduli]